MQEAQIKSSPALRPKRLRILQVIPSLGIGGAEQMVGHLLLGLSRTNDVAGVTLYPARNSLTEKRLRHARVPLWHLEKHNGFAPKIFSSLARVVREFQPHVVHTHLSVLRYLAPALLSHSVPLVIHTLHNLAEHETDSVGHFINRFAFRHGVLAVAISQEVAASFEQFYRRKPAGIVPNGIPVNQYESAPDDGARWRETEGFDRDVVLFTSVARLEPQKNPFLLLRAFLSLNAERAHLVFLGSGSLMEELKAYIYAHGLEERVHALGKRDNVRECLAASDVFVMSSDWEGNPLSVMEAMGASLPVVSTAVGGVPELVRSGEDGILVPAGDCAALTEAMRLLLDNTGIRMAMGRSACARASAEFGVERMVEGYMNMYHAALN
jgi:glycosyltransferase involved in cell wall biosynthesis